MGKVLVIFTILVFIYQTSAGNLSGSEDQIRTKLLDEVRSENLSICFGNSNSKPTEKTPTLNNKPNYTNTISYGLKGLMLFPIIFHQKFITNQDGPVCIFIPNCSAYGYTAIKRYGLLGVLMTAERLLRCHAGNQQYYPSLGDYAYDPVD